jgi:hypothetical protein
LFLIHLNADKDGIHFRNGRFNLITGQVEERVNIITQAVKNPHLVSKFIPYDWVPSSMEDMNEFHASVLFYVN